MVDAERALDVVAMLAGLQRAQRRVAIPPLAYRPVCLLVFRRK
jgi:hypothetical protein